MRFKNVKLESLPEDVINMLKKKKIIIIVCISNEFIFLWHFFDSSTLRVITLFALNYFLSRRNELILVCYDKLDSACRQYFY